MSSGQKRHFYWGVILVCFLIISIIIQSRAFITGCCVGIIYFWATKKDFKFKRHQILITVAGLLILLLLLSILFKSDSTAGRLLIYKVSFKILAHHWLNGIGWGNFKAEYLNYQADYFKAGHYSTKELLLAGNTYFAFNDYYQFVIELGIKGVLLLIALFYYIIRFFNYIADHKAKNDFIVLIQSLIIIITIAALFTHVFDKVWFQLLIINLLALLITIVFFQSKRWRVILPVTFLNSILLLNNYYYPIIHHQAYSKFQYTKVLVREGYNLESIQILDSVYSVYRNDFSFLKFYADRLLLNDDPKRAIFMLKKAITMQPENELYVNLGKAWQSINENNKADSAFQTAIYMVPNRFRSRYELFKFYLATNQFSKAKICGEEILRLPIKIPSSQISFIKRNIMIFLHEGQAVTNQVE